MWERILIAVIIELIRRKVSTKGYNKEDFHRVVRITKSPPDTLEKLLRHSIIREILIRVLGDIIEKIPGAAD